MVSPKTFRIVFEKTGKLQYISHLDLLRTMQTALRRAKVPVGYSEGFNPHMKINFALPLSIGIESKCEFMDVKIAGEVRPSYVKENLSRNLPSEMKIIDVYEPETKFTDIKYAGYTLWLDYGEESSKAAEMGKELFSKPLVITKHTKSGDKEVDIQPMIRNILTEFEFGCVVIKTELSASSETYLNPVYLITALDREVGHEVINRRILRTGALDASGKAFK